MQSVSRIQSFLSCGYSAFVYRSVEPPHKYRLGGSSCRDRYCIPCAKDRSRCLATNVLNVLKGEPTRFVTLTLKQTDASLLETLNRLYDCFRRLRLRAFWKQHVRGGCGFLEIKWGEQNQRWNVHLHCIVHGRFIPQRQLSTLWYEITTDSMIADVRFVHDHDRIGRYVTKYVSKPFNNTFIAREPLIDEVVHATKGRRLCLTFGDWRGIKLTESPNDTDWIALGTFHDVITRAVHGDRDCLQAIHDICGENAELLMDAIAKARPPPKIESVDHAQLTFVWTEPLLREIR